MEVTQSVRKSLDSIRRMAPSGAEYWMARDLQAPLGYNGGRILREL